MVNHLCNCHLRYLFFLCVSIVLLLSFPGNSSAIRWNPERQWYTYEYGDVLVHAPQGFEAYAAFAAERSETWLDTLGRWYGRDTRPSRVHVVLNPDQIINTAFASILPMRTEVPLHPALDKGIRPQTGLYLDRVLAHELTHTIQMNTTWGVTRYARTVFGEIIAPVGLQPDWAIEGMAILTESIDGGGRMNSNYHRMLWRTPVLEDKQWNLEQAAFPGIYTPPANRAYVTGSEMVRMLWGEGLGQRNFSTWLHAQAVAFGRPGSAFRRTFSDVSPTFYFDHHLSDSRAAYRRFMFNRFQIGLGSGEKILSTKRTSYRHPVWTDNNELYVIREGYDRPRALVHVHGDSLRESEEIRLLGYSPQYGMDTQYGSIVLADYRRSRDASQSSESVLIRVTSGGSTHTLGGTPIYGWSPAWNEAQHELAYLANQEDGSTALQVVPVSVYGLVATEEITVFSTRLGSIASPAWSDDGEWLAYVIDLGDGECVRVWNTTTDETLEIRLARSSCTWDPTFAPNGNLWVSADPENIFDLFEIDIANDECLRRTRVLSGAFEPAISPDGQQVAYAHYTSDGFALALLDSSRMRNESAEVDISPVSVHEESLSETLPDVLPAAFVRYNPFKYQSPLFWLPWIGGVDEMAYGALAYGRDPLGFLEWRLEALYGADSQKPDILARVNWNHAPVDISASFHVFPEQLEARYIVGHYPDMSPIILEKSDYKLWYSSRLTFSRPFYFDTMGFRRYLMPYAGLTSLSYQNPHHDYNLGDQDRWTYSENLYGFRVGAVFQSSNSARRDPVPRRFYYGFVDWERNLDPNGSVATINLRGLARVHHPLPINGFVFGVEGALHIQTDEVNYGQALILPRGVSSDDLSYSLKHGVPLRASMEMHFPIAVTDAGLGLGWLHHDRITGLVFADGLHNLEQDLEFHDRSRENSVFSTGLEIRNQFTALFRAPFVLSTGAAYTTIDYSFSYYVKLGIPLDLGLLNPDSMWLAPMD